MRGTLEDEPLTPAPDRGSEHGASAPRHRRDRSSLLIPILLAALGLTAAVIAWRASEASRAIDHANGAGLTATRQRATSQIIDEGLTARTTEAFLDYERARRRADVLVAAGLTDEALLARMEATSHWFLVRPEYIDRNGAFAPDQERAALLAADATQRDLDAAPHFAVADREALRIRGLILAGIIVALAVPFLTLAEVGRGRLRFGSLGIGSAIFLIGLILAVTAWL